MIPDFKTFIKESIWSDMEDRGSGDQAKKEDEVMLMDGERFYEYLNERYSIDSSKLDKNTKIYYHSIKNNTSCFLDIPLFAYNPPTLQIYDGVQDKASFLYYPDDNAIGFGCTSVRYHKLIGLRLEKQFVSQEKGISYYDNYFHGVDNEKVIEMLEFMIDNMKEPLIPILKRK